MNSARIEAWWRARVVRGQRQLADTIRMLVYRADPVLFGRLDFEDDASFLDPLLFAYFTDPAPAAGLEALFPPAGKAGPVRLRAGVPIPNTPFALHPAPDALFHRFFRDVQDRPAEYETQYATRQHRRHLVKALAVLQAHAPILWEGIASTTRRVVLFRSETANAFATISAHGAVFCNVLHAVDEVSLLEDLAHQCGHVIFNALTLDKERFLAVDSETPMLDITGEAGERRDVYGAFHGLFTYSTICHALDGCLRHHVFAGEQLHRLVGHLGFTLRRFEADLARFDAVRLLHPPGRRCHAAFAALFQTMRARHGALVDPLDFSNQPYAFSYRRFAELNPPTPAALAAG